MKYHQRTQSAPTIPRDGGKKQNQSLHCDGSASRTVSRLSSRAQNCQNPPLLRDRRVRSYRAVSRCVALLITTSALLTLLARIQFPNSGEDLTLVHLRSFAVNHSSLPSTSPEWRDSAPLMETLGGSLTKLLGIRGPVATGPSRALTGARWICPGSVPRNWSFLLLGDHIIRWRDAHQSGLL